MHCIFFFEAFMPLYIFLCMFSLVYSIFYAQNEVFLMNFCCLKIVSVLSGVSIKENFFYPRILFWSVLVFSRAMPSSWHKYGMRLALFLKPSVTTPLSFVFVSMLPSFSLYWGALSTVWRISWQVEVISSQVARLLFPLSVVWLWSSAANHSCCCHNILRYHKRFRVQISDKITCPIILHKFEPTIDY